MMALEKPKVACTIKGAMQLGSTVRNMSRSTPAPAKREGGLSTSCSTPS